MQQIKFWFGNVWLNKAIRRHYNALLFSFFWNAPFRYILENYQPQMIDTVQIFYNRELFWRSGGTLVFFALLDIANLVIYSLVPLLMTIFFSFKV
jgi:hypothetical protein